MCESLNQFIPLLTDPDSSPLDLLNLDFEEAISATGYGLFHRLLVAVCGIVTATEAVHIVSVAFLLPAAECEIKMSSQQKGWLNAATFIGMMIGSPLWGAVSDWHGRRSVLIVTLLITGVTGAIMSLMQSYATLFIAIILCGFGSGGTISVIWAYFTEFQQLEYRSVMLSYLSAYWMVGNVLVAAFAYVVIPTSIGYSSESFSFTSWRIFVAICALPNFLSAVCVYFLPESPKFLLVEGHEIEAIIVLAMMIKINKPPIKTPLAKQLMLLSNMKRPATGTSSLTKGCHKSKNTLRSCGPACHQMMMRSLGLLSHQYRATFLTILFIRFTLAFGYFGLWLWLPEFFKRMEMQHKESQGLKPVSLCDIEKPKGEDHDHCKHPMESETFLDEMLVAACNFPGHVLTIVFLDAVGRRLFTFTGMVFSGLSVLTVWMVTSRFSCLMLAALFGALTVLCHSSISVLAMEVFPTDLRGTAWGICQMVARAGAIIGNVLFGLLVDQACSVPVLMVAAILIAGGLACYMLPKTTSAPLK